MLRTIGIAIAAFAEVLRAAAPPSAPCCSCRQWTCYNPEPFVLLTARSRTALSFGGFVCCI